MINPETLKKILAAAHHDAGECKNNCYSFDVMFSLVEPGTWYVRYVRADLSDPVKPKENYRYLCFDREGKHTGCDLVFSSRHAESEWLKTLVSLKKIDYHYQLIEDDAA